MPAPLARATTPGKLRDAGKRARVEAEARHATDPTTAPPCRDAPRLRSGAGPGPDPGRGRRVEVPIGGDLGRGRDLHAAAAREDADAIRRLAAAGAYLNARDGNGRTPLHVAVFQGHRTAARTLLAAGADPALLDSQRYDAVTIAAVR